MQHLLRALALPFALALTACSSGGGGNPTDGGNGLDGGGNPDAMTGDVATADAGTDARTDARTDAHPDTGPTSTCGDGVITGNEVCDDHNTNANDGCSADCLHLDPGYVCPTPGQPCVMVVVCGNGRVDEGETCDDRNTTPGDGCDAQCHLEAGWSCPNVGVACVAARCGDGIIAGNEDCEDGGDPPVSGDGCDAQCHLESGFVCGAAGTPCRATHCGDGVPEGSEQCDDGNADVGDGCTPFCMREPQCTNGTCTPVCGDGVILAGDTTEQCDDGNTRAGDGCSPTCQREQGFTCVASTPAPPDHVDIPITYRDFRGNDLPGGHPDFENVNMVDPGILLPDLDANRRPVYAGLDGNPTTHGQTAYDQWYRDTAGVNVTVSGSLRLDRQTDGSYVFDSDAFFPLDTAGWVAMGMEPLRGGNDGGQHNFSFTSELRYWFEYRGGEQLTFRGDDDVWVFINNKLAIDLGGVHGPTDGAITLDATNAGTFGLTVGGIYEVLLLQAERHTSGSSYRLTLNNFNAQTTRCDYDCGDGFVTRFEACDDGVNDGSYGSCTPDCQMRAAHCGDGVVQTDHGEQCDDGNNLGGYGMCNPGCLLGARCGDGVVQSDHGEECDDGNSVNNDGCSNACTMPPPG